MTILSATTTLFQNPNTLPKKTRGELENDKQKIESELKNVDTIFKDCINSFYVQVDKLRALQNKVNDKIKSKKTNPTELRKLKQQVTELTNEINKHYDNFEKGIAKASSASHHAKGALEKIESDLVEGNFQPTTPMLKA